MEEQRLDRQDEKKRAGGGQNRFWLGVLTGALVMAFVGLIIVGMSAGIYLFGRRVMSRQPQSGAPAITDDSSKDLDFKHITSKMEMIQQIIDQVFLYDEDEENVEDYIYRGMLAGLDDPYSVYYSEEDYKMMQESTSGTYSGIGAMISQNRTTGLSTVVKVFDGSPALEAGMKPGDVIYKVEDALDAYTFAQINDGNAIAIPFAKGFGWGGDLNLEYIFEKLFCEPSGQGYPRERAVPEQRNKRILDDVRKASFREDLVEIFKGLDQELVKGAFSGEKFGELFFGKCKDEKLAAYIRELIG